MLSCFRIYKELRYDPLLHYLHMIQNTIKINHLIFLSQKCKTLSQLKQVHVHFIKSQIPQDPLFSAATSSGNSFFFAYVCSIFEHLRSRNTFIYNNMIRGHVQSCSPLRAIACYLHMLNCGVAANNYTFPPLIKACTMLVPNSKLIGRLVHAHVAKFGFQGDPFVVSAFIGFYSFVVDMGTARMLFDKSPKKDVVIWTSMIYGYGKMGDVENARALFDEMPERNVISWSAIMTAYSWASDFKEVICLFEQMQNVGTKPNESILVSVLTACAHLGAMTQGLWVHSYAKNHNFGSNPILATALVDLYSKCGSVKSAFSVFEGIPIKDASAWNAMITGLSMNGHARKSLELFNKMAADRIQPTGTTFVAVLTACTHARMVDEGLKLFHLMSNIYGIKPRHEHYACVVDLLSRAGMVEEAEKFIEEKMGGFEGLDGNVWGALLGACRTYGNVEVGNRVSEKLADMEVEDSGIHVTSYNIYNEAGWEMEAKKSRKMISEVGMKKPPGCSVIEINGVFEEFFAGDLYHPQAQKMFKILDYFPKMANLEDT